MKFILKFTRNPKIGVALKYFEFHENSFDLFSLASTGLDFHLTQASSVERDVGMIVAQMILNKLRPNAENKLEFEFYDPNWEASFTKLINPEETEIKTSFLDIIREKKAEIKEETSIESDRESLDSDDFEFEPFDWSNSLTSKYAPKYILEASDTLSGFGLPPNVSHTEKANRTAAALSSIPYLAEVNSEQAAKIGLMNIYYHTVWCYSDSY